MVRRLHDLNALHIHRRGVGAAKVSTSGKRGCNPVQDADIGERSEFGFQRSQGRKVQMGQKYGTILCRA